MAKQDVNDLVYAIIFAILICAIPYVIVFLVYGLSLLFGWGYVLSSKVLLASGLFTCGILVMWIVRRIIDS